MLHRLQSVMKNLKIFLLGLFVVIALFVTFLPVLLPKLESLYGTILKERAQKFSVTFPAPFVNKPMIEKQLMTNGDTVYEIKGWFVEQPKFNTLRSLMSLFAINTPNGSLVVPVYLGVRGGNFLIGKGKYKEDNRYSIEFGAVSTENLETMIIPYRPVLLRITIAKDDARKLQEGIVKEIQEFGTGIRKKLSPAATLLPDAVILL